MFESVEAQTYKDWRMIVSYDKDDALRYIPEKCNVNAHRVYPRKGYPYFYDLYCNELKNQVLDGWFFFLDDDDFLVDTNSLQTISEKLQEDRGLICQFIRNRRPKPSDGLMQAKRIIRGNIGMPCLFLHAKHKNIADLDGQAGGDYRWIKNVSEKIPVDFFTIPVVATDNNRLYGKMEKV